MSNQDNERASAEPLIFDHMRSEIDRLERDARSHLRLVQQIATYQRGGIVEVAAINASVSDYMRHWEGRALKAEARVAELEAADPSRAAQQKEIARQAFEAGHFAWPNHDAPSRADQFENWWKIQNFASDRDVPSPQEPEKEVCICAAIRLDDGYIVRGHRHDDCIHTITKLRQAGRDVGQPRQEAQGFVTSRGRFVSREEGADLHQGIFSPYANGPFHGSLLFSEDLY